MSTVPIVYADTNVLSLLVKEPTLRHRLTRVLLDHDAGLGLSDANILELQRASRIHRDLVELLKFYPTALIKPASQILDEEVAAYPAQRSGDMHLAVLFAPDVPVDEHQLLAVLSDPRIVAASDEMARHAADVPPRHAALRGNFPPRASGKYNRSQAAEFADLLTTQWLASSHPAFAREQVQVGPLSLASFRSLRMHAYLVFWRFYLNRRTPNATSDLGDQAHARHYPYCHTLIVEEDAANTLRQIQRHSDLLDGITILSVRDLRTLPE